MNKYLGKIGHFSAQMNPVITNSSGPAIFVRTKMAGPELFVITEFDCMS